MAQKRNDLLGWLTFMKPPAWSKGKVFGSFVGVCLCLLLMWVIVLVIGALWVMSTTLFSGDAMQQQSNAAAMRGTAVFVTAALSAPFIIWRTLVAAKQAELQDKSLFNDKINAATEELAARKEVTRSVLQDKEEVILTEWKDDLVRRAAAIDRLEGLAAEQPDEAMRIARLLCGYVKELSHEYPAEEVPEDATPDDLRAWAVGLQVKRRDMERAVKSLSRINSQIQDQSETGPQKVINLDGANLQGFHLKECDLSFASLERASLQGVSLVAAKMHKAKLHSTMLQGADFEAAEMQEADLMGAEMQGVALELTELRGADLYLARIDENTLIEESLPRGTTLKILGIEELNEEVELSRE